MSDPSDLLSKARTIAVVGASGTPGKAAHDVPVQLIAAGWEVIPVNPSHDELYGRRCYPSVADIGRRVDLVDVFRPPSDAPDVVRQAVEAGAGAVWLQLGITSDEGRRIATDAGAGFVEDSCTAVVARQGGLHPPG